ncbi:colicin import membrane protein [Mariprofundus ferrinatatus]|uniref:Colicin import membrane protein n=1 Tax=Mariprofundus ferrinatatus TaxID=1921087 RepID=A0A2K8L5N4_9PROT|nr:hypothetical protein [Mariprofundus ferrinatatus]ATX81161.1 colicin import membrane protein [Mariprofundus ferrinatatus]
MDKETEALQLRLVEMHQEIMNLREGYRITSQRYTDAIALIHNHAKQAEQAAKQTAERVKEAAKKASDATELAAQIVEIAATLAQDKAEERGRVLLDKVKLFKDVAEALKAHIAEAAHVALEAQTNSALAVKAVADSAAEAVADVAVSAAAAAEELEADIMKSSHGN